MLHFGVHSENFASQFVNQSSQNGRRNTVLPRLHSGHDHRTTNANPHARARTGAKLPRTWLCARVPQIISRDEALSWRETALRYSQSRASLEQSGIFTQLVNAWLDSDGMRGLTLHPNLASAATQLAGVPLRLWHDHLLIKQPHNSKPTEFHQDQPYWPHTNSSHPISCWIALGDVPVASGCMTFLPESQKRSDLPAQNLGDDRSLFSIAPDLEWSERVTLPLRAGDCTFHHGRCAHMATPNFTNEARVAHVVIFMDADTRYTGTPHLVTDGQNLPVGETLDGELFPRV